MCPKRRSVRSYTVSFFHAITNDQISIQGRHIINVPALVSRDWRLTRATHGKRFCPVRSYFVFAKQVVQKKAQRKKHPTKRGMKMPCLAIQNAY